MITAEFNENSSNPHNLTAHIINPAKEKKIPLEKTENDGSWMQKNQPSPAQLHSSCIGHKPSNSTFEGRKDNSEPQPEMPQKCTFESDVRTETKFPILFDEVFW